MTSKEAKSILNAYRNRNYNSTFRDELELAKAIDIVLPKYVELEEENKMLKAQNYIYNLENIQLKQDNSLILNNQEQSKALFNYIAEVYEELDSLMARLQDDYNNSVEFEQREEDRLVIGNILDIFTDLENALPLKKAMENFLEGEEDDN